MEMQYFGFKEKGRSLLLEPGLLRITRQNVRFLSLKIIFKQS